MFGPSLFSVFRSRWRALWWSAGILLLAYCAVPAPQRVAAAKQDGAADVTAVADALKSLDEAQGE